MQEIYDSVDLLDVKNHRKMPFGEGAVHGCPWIEIIRTILI
jgi:hypothetical protein